MKSATDTLDGIRAGGQQMVLNAHSRINELREALENGDFEGALVAVTQLHDRIAHLAHAQVHLAACRAASITKVAELEAGMRADGGAEVVSIEDCPCPVATCRKKIVTFDNGVQQPMMPEWELLILDE